MDRTPRRAHKPKCNVWKYYKSEVATNGQSIVNCVFCSTQFTSSTAKNATKLRQHLMYRCLEIDDDMKRSIVKEVDDENRHKYNEVIIEDFDDSISNKDKKIITKIVVKNDCKLRVKQEVLDEDIGAQRTVADGEDNDRSSHMKTLKAENLTLGLRLKECLKQNESLIEINKYLEQSLKIMEKMDSLKVDTDRDVDDDEEYDELMDQLKASNRAAKEWKSKYRRMIAECDQRQRQRIAADVEDAEEVVNRSEEQKPRPKKASSIWKYFKRIPDKTSSSDHKVIKCLFCRKTFRHIHLNAYKCRQHIVEFCTKCPKQVKQKENQWVEYKPRSKVDIWQHFKVTEEDNKTSAECFYCGYCYSYKNATKFRQHLVFKCHAIPDEVKEDIRSQCDQSFLDAFDGQSGERSKMSDIFEHFDIREDKDGKLSSKCLYCQQMYSYKNATKFRQHLVNRCNAIPSDVRNEIVDRYTDIAKTWTQTNIDVWKYFDVTEEDGKTNCRCVYCGFIFAYKNATKSRLHLTLKCPQIPDEEKEKILKKCIKDLTPKKAKPLLPKERKERKQYVRSSLGKGGRRKGLIWQHFTDETDDSGNTRRVCNYCGHTFGVGVSRNATKMKEHLGLFCKVIPEEVKQIVVDSNANSVRTYKKRQLQPLQWLECEWPGCEMKFPKRSRLLNHQMIHTGVIRIKCDWPGCEWTGRSRYAVNVHKHSHTGEKPYVCDWPGCDFRTANTASLCVHKMRHKNLLRYKCDWPQCERTFLTSSQRTVHKMVHLGIKPYGCQFCDKRYPQLNKLKTHQNKQHSNQRQFFDYQNYKKQ